MADLTPRQLKILKTIIEEHIQTGEPVGSETLDKKYNLGVSPATIRNEMSRMEEAGYLAQPHTSAGRVPTNSAYKLYITQLMQEKQLSIADEVTVKEKIGSERDQLDRFLTQATRTLAQKTDALAITLTDSGDLYHSGYAHLLELPEFYDIDATKTLLSIIEDVNILKQILAKTAQGEEVHILLGEDLGQRYLSSCGLIYTKFSSPWVAGEIGVFGATRFDYPWIVPTVRYFGSLLNDILENWEEE